MKSDSEGGFTLIEVLVAFSILSLTIIVGIQIFSSGLNRIDAVEGANDRLAQAKALLVQVQLGTEFDALSTAATNLKISRTILANEGVNWTNLKPVRVQVLEGDKVILETIILSTYGPQ